MHLTSQLKIEKDLGWETVQARAEMPGLTAYYKIHHNLTRPLTRTCMTDNDNRLVNLRKNGSKRVRHPYSIGHTMVPNILNLLSPILQNYGMTCLKTKDKLT